MTRSVASSPSGFKPQQLLARAGLAGLAVVLAAWAVFDERWGSNGLARVAFAAILLGALGVAIARDRRDANRGVVDNIRRWELAALALVLAIQAPRWVTGGLAASLHGLIFIWVALAASFLRTKPLVAIAGFAGVLLAGTEAILGWEGTGALVARFGLLVSCGAVLRFSVGARLRETERGNELRVERQLTDLRDEARAYRLSSAPSVPGGVSLGALSGSAGAMESQTNKELDERLLHSSVEEIQGALTSCLYVCRAALGARSALALWLTESGDELVVRGSSSEVEKLHCGPFSAREGVFGAALDGNCPVELAGASASRPLPYYAQTLPVGHVAVLPLKEADEVVGLLVVDRVEAEPLSDAHRQLLMESGRLACRTIDNERLLLSSDRAKVQQGKLYRAVERLNKVRSEADVIEAGVSSARDFAAFDFAAVTVVRSGGEHEICAVSGPQAEKLVGRRFRNKDGLVAMVVDNAQSLPYRGECDAGFQVVFTRALPISPMKSLLVVPLLFHDKVLGTLVLASELIGAFAGEVRLPLQVLARHMAVSLSNARMVKRLEELATTDGLTKLLNKRALLDVAHEKLRTAQRFGTPVAVIVCDLDHFKLVNDRHGHDVGDKVIAGFADVLRRTKRETDAVGRFGGEEFVVICEHTDEAGAVLLAERIRVEMEATQFVSQSGSLQVTCSLGIATRPAAGSDWTSLFKAADEALYCSKTGGRNRATVWQPGPVSSARALPAVG